MADEEFDDNGLARFTKPKTADQNDQPNTVNSTTEYKGIETVKQVESENHEIKSKALTLDEENDEDQKKTKEKEQRVKNRPKPKGDLLDVNNGTTLSKATERKNSETPHVAQEIAEFLVALIKSSKLLNFSRHLMLLISISVLFPGAEGTLVVSPKDVIGLKGEVIRLPCSTQFPHSVYWERIPVGSSEEQTIYYGRNGLVNMAGVNGRFKIDSDPKTGRYDLVIKDLQPMDAATYICSGNDGHGERKRAQLVVLEYFSCEMPMPSNGFMGENTVNLPEHSIQASCSLRYHGHVTPHIQWRLNDNHVNASRASNGSNVWSVMTFRGTKEVNGAKLSSLPTLSNAHDPESVAVPWWTSAQLKVNYIHLELVEVVDCQDGSTMVPVCLPSCEYKRVEIKAEDLCCCMAVYNMDGVNYNITFYKHHCHGWNSVSSISTVVTITAASVLGLVILIAAIVMFFVFIIRRYRSSGTNTNVPHQEAAVFLQIPMKG